MAPAPEVRALAERCERRTNDLAREMVRTWIKEIPDFHALPADMQDVETAATARHAIRLFLQRLGGLTPDAAAHAVFRERAAQRAEEGVPLQTLMRTYTIGSRVLFESMRADAGPHEQSALVEIALLLMVASDEVITQVVQAYQDELAAIASAHHDRHRALARDLILGGAPAEPAAIEEFRLGGGAVVLTIRLEVPEPADDDIYTDTDSPTDTDTDIDVALGQSDQPDHSGAPAAESRLGVDVSARRRLRRIQGALDRFLGRTMPTLLETAGGHVLVPRAEPALLGILRNSPRQIEDQRSLGELAQRLAEAWHGQVWLTTTVADRPEQISAAARTGGEVLRLAERLGRPSGLYRLTDVLLEYHLARDDESAAQLRGIIAPLEERPELLETVRVYLARDYDRRATAARLGLHPNTVDNRLARAAELTGLDLSTPRGVATLVTALTLRDLAAP